MKPDFALPNGAQVFEVLEQGTDEWLQVRAGLATASRFDVLLVKGKGENGLGAGAITYAREVAGELIAGTPEETFSNPYMERGKRLEDQIRTDYEFMTDSEVQEVGFITRNGVGYSPDGLVGLDGLVEFKNHKREKVIAMILAEEFPKEHFAQCLGGLYVTGRDWIDLCAYSEGLPHFVRRLERADCEKELAQLEEAIQRFNGFVSDVVERVRAYGNQ